MAGETGIHMDVAETDFPLPLPGQARLGQCWAQGDRLDLEVGFSTAKCPQSPDLPPQTCDGGGGGARGWRVDVGGVGEEAAEVGGGHLPHPALKLEGWGGGASAFCIGVGWKWAQQRAVEKIDVS